MKRRTIKGKVLEFDADTHEYIYDGVLLPSVTSILSKNAYKHVSPVVLKRASEYGTYIHKLIEDYEANGITPEERPIEFRNYLFLKKMYGFKVLHSELPLVIWRGDEPVLAGTLDVVTEYQGQLCVEDYKIRSTVDREEVAKQLNLYRLGLKQSYDIEANKLFCTQIKKTTRRRFELPINEEYTLNIIKEI